MTHRDSILSAYRKAIRQSSGWRETYGLPWWERLWRHPVLTLRSALIDRFWTAVIALGLHDPLLPAHTFWGDRMQVTFPDYRSVYHYGLVDGRELPVENFLVQFLKDGDVCLDVGANVGIYTLLCSALVGAGGKVYAFEPTPRTFTILTANSAGKSNVTRVSMALMEEEGKRNLVDYGVEKSGLNTVLLQGSEQVAQPDILPVEATTLDAYCTAHSICPSFIKIDTEGAEEMVLAGGRKTFIRHHPTLIVEVQRDAPQQTIALLTGLGYQPYQFVGNTPVPYANGDTLGCPNMLFMYEN